MSRKRLKRGVGGSSDRFIQIPHYMIDSQGWHSLPGDAIKLLIAVWRRHNGVNNGEISFGCGEAPKSVAFSKATAARMFDLLRYRGFLAIVREAQFKSPWARSWRITAERHNGNSASKDYMRWRPETGNKNDSPSLTRETASLTRETVDIDLTPTVSPERLETPKPSALQSHQRDTYNIPCEGDEKTPAVTAPTWHQANRSVERPLPHDWKPGRRATVEARVEGLREGRLADVTRQFVEYHANSGAVSDDWLREFRNFVRNIVQTEKREADKIFGPKTSKTTNERN